MNYYNEFDPRAAAWLRELILYHIIPDGKIDQRSITDVQPTDLAGFTQCHFFAGIGGWAYALALAGWPSDRPVWSGSCPCQPFSVAGKGLGTDDERHLWPAWFRLIRECRPGVVFGEQVASKAALGWFDGVCSDMEGAGYACGAADLCAASAGAPHIRQRLFWVSDLEGERWNGAAVRAESGGRREFTVNGDSCRPSDAARPEGARLGQQQHVLSGPQNGVSGLHDAERGEEQPATAERLHALPGGAGAWSNFDILPFRDGKSRRVETGTFPLAHGVSGRVGLLRGYGNAIVSQIAAEFIQAYLETKTPFVSAGAQSNGRNQP